MVVSLSFINLYYYYFFSQNKFRLRPTLYSTAGSHKTVLLSSCVYDDRFVLGQIQTRTQYFRFLSLFSTKLLASKVMKCSSYKDQGPIQPMGVFGLMLELARNKSFHRASPMYLETIC